MAVGANFTHHFLIAMPAMTDPNFARTLTWVCEHNDDGALGIVVNRPTDMTLSTLFEQVELPVPGTDVAARPCTSAAPSRSTAASCCTGRSATGSRRWR